MLSEYSKGVSMLKWAVAMTGFGLAAMAAGVSAKDKLEPRTQAMLACRGIAADDARLACYDQAMTALNLAIEQGAVVVEKNNKPMAREGVVKASRQIGDNVFWVELDNGDRWKLLPSTRRKGPPQVGSTVKVHKPLYGSGFWIVGPEWDDSRADFEGRGS
jgi:hypothetical protein